MINKNPISEMLEKPAPPIYPIRIKFYKEDFERDLKRFISIISNKISLVKAEFERMKLNSEFTDEVWSELCINRNILWKLHSEKISEIADKLGIDDQQAEKLVDKPGPFINRIENYVGSIPQALTQLSNTSKAHLNPREIVNVNGSPMLSDEALNVFREAYTVYIHNSKEHDTMDMLQDFANRYYAFLNNLTALGYGPHINGIASNSFISNLFEEQDNNHLEVDLSAPAYLARLKKEKIIKV